MEDRTLSGVPLGRWACAPPDKQNMVVPDFLSHSRQAKCSTACLEPKLVGGDMWRLWPVPSGAGVVQWVQAEAT